MSGSAVVLGAGRSGTAAAALLRREGCAVDVLDGAMPFPADCAYEFAVTSPGIPLDHPWQRECRARGVKVISELQLGWDRWRAMGGRALAITGSKGKSSVVKLVADALGGVPCGNYGRPLCDVVNDFVSRRVEDAAPYQLSNSPTPRLSDFPTFQLSNFSTFQLPWAVVEVSSFQMETTDDFHPDAAALLNLQEDHLDRHGTRETYHALKRKLIEGAHQDRAMVGRAVPSPPGGALRTTRPTMAAHAFDASGMADADVPPEARALFAGSYFDNPVLAPNGAAAVWLMREAGLGDDAIRKAFASFEPLPHRMQTVCERGGVRYIDDSKATSLAALAAGVRMAGRPVRLIAGGLGKGDDAFSLIIRLQSAVKKVYLIGRCADQLFDAWHSAMPCEKCGTLEVAVEAASRDARPGEAVLLSPGAASFDQFNNFGERGDRFAAIVMKESKKMNAKFGMLLGANLAVASIFMQGCKATKPHGGDQPPPPPHSSVDRPLPPPRTALENDIETTTLPPPPPPASATKVKPLPPPPPDAVPPPKAAPEPAIYIVQKGDTLSQICEKRGVRMSETLKLNPALAANPNRILVGAKIKLPAPGAALVPPPEAAAPGAKAQKLPPPPPAGAKKADDKKADVKPAPKGAAANVKAPAAKKAAYKPYTGPTKEYVVKSGDQLGKIAYSFGITVRALKELNGLAANDLKVGQKLKVPAEKVKPEEAKQDAPAAADKKDVGADAAAKKDDKAAAEPANKAAEPEKKANDAAPAASDAAPADLGAKADAPALSQSYETYVVKEGDDLVSIAINFGVSPSALMDLNDLKTGDSVKPGQTLKIPAGAKAP